MGQTPHILAKAASERIRSVLSPAVTSISAVVSNQIPNRSSIRGAAALVSVFRWLVWVLISS
jgi:hypothetical protein